MWWVAVCDTQYETLGALHATQPKQKRPKKQTALSTTIETSTVCHTHWETIALPQEQCWSLARHSRYFDAHKQRSKSNYIILLSLVRHPSPTPPPHKQTNERALLLHVDTHTHSHKLTAPFAVRPNTTSRQTPQQQQRRRRRRTTTTNDVKRTTDDDER